MTATMKDRTPLSMLSDAALAVCEHETNDNAVITEASSDLARAVCNSVSDMEYHGNPRAWPFSHVAFKVATLAGSLAANHGADMDKTERATLVSVRDLCALAAEMLSEHLAANDNT